MSEFQIDCEEKVKVLFNGMESNDFYVFEIVFRLVLYVESSYVTSVGLLNKLKGL